MEEIIAFTVVLELPHDLGFDNVAVFGFEDGPAWEGWDEASMARMIRFDRELEAGRRPMCRVMLRQTRVRSRLPLQAADKVYSGWVLPLLPLRHRVLRRLVYRVASLWGLRETATVAAVTAFLPSAGTPDTPDPEWVQEQVQDAIAVLNRLLICVGIEGNNPRVGPIYVADLPALVPVIFETQPVATKRRTGGTFLHPLHQWLPTTLKQDGHFDELQRASDLFRSVQERRTPWFLVLDLTHTARRDGAAGRHESAVIGAATAIEVMAATLVQEVGAIDGWPHARIENVLKAGFRNLLVSHLPGLLRQPVDIDDATTPWGRWWREGYSMRNAVVHEGRKPTEGDAQRAVYAAMDLVAEVGRVLENDPRLETLSVGMPSGVA
jgi:hypothetical protein